MKQIWSNTYHPSGLGNNILLRSLCQVRNDRITSDRAHLSWGWDGTFHHNQSKKCCHVRRAPSKLRGLAECPQNLDRRVEKTWPAVSSFSDDSLIWPPQPGFQALALCTAASLPSGTLAAVPPLLGAETPALDQSLIWKNLSHGVRLKCSQLPHSGLPTIPMFGIAHVSLWTSFSTLRQLAQIQTHLRVLKAIVHQGVKTDVCHTHFLVTYLHAWNVSS